MMIYDNTVLILGAGASQPYGLPLGSELRDDVIKSKHKIWLTESLDELDFDHKYYPAFASDLATSGFPSVDAFLESRDKWLDIGKCAIAYHLIIHENNANLFPPNQPKKDHWYENLWLKLKTTSWAKFKKNKLKIITFNYDRSLEYYLGAVLANNYNIRMETAVKGLVKALNILHVHGDLGYYKFEKDYRKLTSGQLIKKGMDSIKIVHESDNTSKEFKAADEVLNNAERILFIGFGYHPQNMKKMEMFKNPKKRKRVPHRKVFTRRIYGTHKGFKVKAWGELVKQYEFSIGAEKQGAGSISEFISELL